MREPKGKILTLVAVVLTVSVLWFLVRKNNRKECQATPEPKQPKQVKEVIESEIPETAPEIVAETIKKNDHE